MSDRATASGTSVIGGAEARASRSLRSLLIPIAAVGAALALVPLWVGDSGVLMGVAVLGLAFACYTIGFNLIFDGIGDFINGLFGATAGTNYGENNSLMAITRNYSGPALLAAGVIAILLGFVGKLAALVE